MTLKG